MTPRVEPTQRWIRVRSGGEWIADSKRALLLIQYAGPDRLPTYYLPLSDVRADAVDRASTSDLPELAGHVTFSWDDVDWYEESEQIHVHARDPHKRVDVIPSSRHVRVEVDGHTLADTKRPSLLFETWLPTRYYLPRDDVRTDLLEPSDTTSRCPYKGTARYWSARIGDRVAEDVVWSYPDPIQENPRIKDLLCFFNERVDLTVDGQRQERPNTPWS